MFFFVTVCVPTALFRFVLRATGGTKLYLERCCRMVRKSESVRAGTRMQMKYRTCWRVPEGNIFQQNERWIGGENG